MAGVTTGETTTTSAPTAISPGTRRCATCAAADHDHAAAGQAEA